MQTEKGLIFNIQRFSIHDGPGIRTTVFLKGCPLNCLWCSNPESINPYPEFFLNDTKCILCGKCIKVCKEYAITINKNSRKIDREKCNFCLSCADACSTGAITRVGKFLTVDEVLEEVLSDELFYRNSNGGVTLSGGEPLHQHNFVLELLKTLKEKKLHTALDTAGFCKWDILKEILEYVDLVLQDIKHIDSEKHKEGTGVDNNLIIENAKRTASTKRTWIRVPIIPQYNDSKDFIERIFEFAKNISAEKVSFLPYHEWGKHKYQKLGINYKLENIKSLKTEEVKMLIKNINNFGLEISIGA